MNVLFKERNDDSKRFNIIMPGNIRFGFYQKREDVYLENKFTAMPLSVPLTKDMTSAYKEIKQVTKTIKGSMGFMYGIYAISYWSSHLLPRFLSRQAIN